MAFNVSSEMAADDAKITLSGELDASVAPVFKEEVEKIAGRRPKRLLLMMQNLAYIASAGIRVLVFAKQKMGPGVEIYAIAPQDRVRETFQMTGVHYSLHIVHNADDLDA